MGYSWSTLLCGATIRIGQEMLCLPYAGFFKISCFIKVFSSEQCFSSLNKNFITFFVISKKIFHKTFFSHYCHYGHYNFLHIIKSYSCTLVKVTFLPSSYDRLTNNNTSRAAQDSYIYFVLFLDLSSLNFHQISPLSQFDLVVAMSVCLSV